MFALRRTTMGAARSARSFSSTSAAKQGNMAKLTVIGRLGAAPEARIASTGREYLTYAIVNNHGPRDNQTASWWNVSCFAEGPSKDFIQGLQRGTQVYLEADAKYDILEGEDGKTRRSLNLVQRKLEVLSRPAPRDEPRE